MAHFRCMLSEIIWAMEKMQLRWFQIKLRPAECTQIANSDEDTCCET